MKCIRNGNLLQKQKKQYMKNYFFKIKNLLTDLIHHDEKWGNVLWVSKSEFFIFKKYKKINEFF